jgi:DNA primase small subunit
MDPTSELRKRFVVKYLELVKSFPMIKDFVNREFAFFSWDKNYMIRHKGYAERAQFFDDLKYYAPRHLYASATVYKEPSAKNMSDKGWLGCDFIIDIDADHMELPCSHVHDYYICKGCSYYDKGPAPNKCPKCGQDKFDKFSWLCDECLNVSKQEIVKLVDNFLIPDFGFQLEDFFIKFSGHRGYHLQISQDKVRQLSSDERRHMVDYLTGTGFSYPRQFKLDQATHSFMGSRLDDMGWKGKIANVLYDILKLNDPDEVIMKYNRYQPDRSLIERLFLKENRQYLVTQLKNGNLNWSLPKFGDNRWESLIQFIMNTIKAEVDIPVSIDVHRLIRLEGSIHGKTGFFVKALDYNALKTFDPFNDAILFGMDESSLTPITITSLICPRIRIGRQYYGPYQQNEKIKVPEAVAVFLACKGVADIDVH